MIYEGNPNEGETAVECCTPLHGRGLEIAAAPRETYWTDFHSAAADDEVFDVAFPVR